MASFLTLVSMVLVAAFSRLIPHPWNFTAIGAMALFGGAYFSSKKQSLVVPFLALALSDLVLGFHSTMVFVYAAFLLTVVLGWNLRERSSVVRVGGFSLLASTLFFAITNAGVWLSQGMYTQDLKGLVTCYVAALPFFANQVAGDLFFSAVLFAGYELVKSFNPSWSLSSSKS